MTIGEDQQNGSASTRKRIKRTLVSPNSGPYLGCVASFVSGHGTGECRAPVGARSKRCEHCDKGDHPRLPWYVAEIIKRHLYKINLQLVLLIFVP